MYAICNVSLSPLIALYLHHGIIVIIGGFEPTTSTPQVWKKEIYPPLLTLTASLIKELG